MGLPMKTHPILTKDANCLFAFEIENAYISPRTIARLLAEIDGITDIQLRKRFTQSNDVHVQSNTEDNLASLGKLLGTTVGTGLGLKQIQ